MTPAPHPARAYRGVSPDERRAQRRRKLIDAAIAVYGERGYRHATVKAVCEAAGLTERYFYESFDNSEALLIACFNAVTYGVFGEIAAAAEAAGRGRVARARAMLAAYFSALQHQPASARVFLVEIRGVSREVDRAFDGALRVIGSAVACQLEGRGSLAALAPDSAAKPARDTAAAALAAAVSADKSDTDTEALLQAGVVGGVIHIALRWIDSGYQPPLEVVTDTALRLGMVLARPQPRKAARRSPRA